MIYLIAGLIALAYCMLVWTIVAAILHLQRMKRALRFLADEMDRTQQQLGAISTGLSDMMVQIEGLQIELGIEPIDVHHPVAH